MLQPEPTFLRIAFTDQDLEWSFSAQQFLFQLFFIIFFSYGSVPQIMLLISTSGTDYLVTSFQLVVHCSYFSETAQTCFVSTILPGH